MATILIVDDQPANRDYLVTLLGCRGHRLLEAADGADALTVARAERPCLIIADILMPTMDGYELVRQLRADPAIAQTPVIFCTAHYHEQEARSLALSCGVSMVITKPSEPEDVLRAVESVLGLEQQTAPEPPEYFDREHLRVLTDKLSEKAADLSASNERLSALLELGLQLGTELDHKRLIQGLGQAAREIVGARYAISAIVEADASHPQVAFTSGMDAETVARLGSPDPRAAAIRTVLTEGRTVRLHNPGGDPEAIGFPPSHPAIRSWLGVPISSPTRVYGCLCLIDKIGRDEFSPEDERLAAILGAQVGRVYQNGSLYAGALSHAAELEREIAAREQTEKALAERVRHERLNREVEGSFTRSDTLSDMLRTCADALAGHLDLALVRIWLFDEKENTLQLQVSAGPVAQTDPVPRTLRPGQTETGLIAQLRKSLITNNPHADTPAGDVAWMKQEKLVAFAGHPIVVEDRLLGVVEVFAHQQLSLAAFGAVGAVAQRIGIGIERIRAVAALREREEHIRLLLDSTAEGIYGIDAGGFCTFANAACARMLGYRRPAELLGRRMQELYPGRGRDEGDGLDDTNILHAVRRAAGSHVGTGILWRADGSWFSAEYWSHPIYHDGGVVGTVVTFLDITERLKLEVKFRQAQQRLRQVVVSSPAVLFTVTVTGDEIYGISWTSENVREILGYSPEAAIGADWWVSGIHPDDQQRVMAQTRADLFALGHSTQEYRFRHADGEYRWARCEFRLIRDELGRPVEAVGAWMDITKQKNAEHEQSQLRGQLQQAQKLEGIGRLAGGVAHDFNNLLTVINGYSALLLKRLPADDPSSQLVAEIRTAGDRAAALTRQLLVLSRKQVVQFRNVNLNHIIQEVEQMLARVIREDIHLESLLSPDLGFVQADPGQIHQVIMNLAANARDAMPNGGTLLIETANVDLAESFSDQHHEVTPGSYVELKVSDTGVGMTKEVVSHLFEPFFTTKDPGEGTGLGLATVYSIVKQSGGSIWVYSEPGKGTSFKIYLPRVQAGATVAEEPKAGNLALHGSETILVVEDQEQLRAMAARVLRVYGYQVHEAENAEDALSYARRHETELHLLLTDLVMPGMSGWDLAEEIRTLRPGVAIIFMSGYSERAIRDRHTLDSVGTFLNKPFSLEALALKVREALDANRPAVPAMPANGSGPRSVRVVVADDEPGVRAFFRTALQDEGYEVIEAASGTQVLQEVRTGRVDLVITDLVMPEQQGVDTVRTLRSEVPGIGIIAMSGGFGAHFLKVALAFGADAVMSKPVEAEDLATKVSEVLKLRFNGAQIGHG
jgi:PAS domain S-box-containing protein